nr:MAG TPA: hypothetical protein [Caudoviricetes sp.]
MQNECLLYKMLRKYFRNFMKEFYHNMKIFSMCLQQSSERCNVTRAVTEMW